MVVLVKVSISVFVSIGACFIWQALTLDNAHVQSVLRYRDIHTWFNVLTMITFITEDT